MAALVRGLDVRVDVRPLLGHVVAVRTLKARQLATLVGPVTVEAAVPLVGLAADLAAELTALAVDRARPVQLVLICADRKQMSGGWYRFLVLFIYFFFLSFVWVW